jgi:hypothetical protein
MNHLNLAADITYGPLILVVGAATWLGIRKDSIMLMVPLFGSLLLALNRFVREEPAQAVFYVGLFVYVLLHAIRLWDEDEEMRKPISVVPVPPHQPAWMEGQPKAIEKLNRMDDAPRITTPPSDLVRGTRGKRVGHHRPERVMERTGEIPVMKF